MEWISVKDRLPEKDGEEVLAVVNGEYDNISLINAIVLAEYFEETKEWLICELERLQHPNVTHWMPLPEPPKGD